MTTDVGFRDTCSATGGFVAMVALAVLAVQRVHAPSTKRHRKERFDPNPPPAHPRQGASGSVSTANGPPGTREPAGSSDNPAYLTWSNVTGTSDPPVQGACERRP